LLSPSEAVHQATDMVRVVAHTKLALNHFGYARSGPKIGPVPYLVSSMEGRVGFTSKHKPLRMRLMQNRVK
jgi:hypothetical protein